MSTKTQIQGPPAPPRLTLLFVLALLACGSLSADRQNAAPFFRVDLRAHGFQSNWFDHSSIGFISDKLLVVVINQAVPPDPKKVGTVKDGALIMPLGAYSQGPPAKTLLFDLDSRELVAQAELGNRKSKRTFWPTRDGDFLVRRPQDFALFSSDMKELATQTIELKGKYDFGFRVTPDGRYVTEESGAGEVFDTGSLARSNDFPNSNRESSMVEGAYLERRGDAKHQEVYLHLPGQTPKRISVPNKHEWLWHIEFLSARQFFVDGFVYSLDGSRLYQLKGYDGSEFKTSIGGRRFAQEIWDYKEFFTFFKELGNDPRNRRTVRVWDTETGRKVFELRRNILRANSDVALSPDGLKLALLYDGSVELYNLAPIR